MSEQPAGVASVSEGLLEEITRRVVAVSRPEKVILFGSHARHEAAPDSDVDLLVIVDEADTSGAETNRILRALSGIRVTVDVVVVSSAYAERYGDLIGTVLRPALREGRVLYDRRTA